MEIETKFPVLYYASIFGQISWETIDAAIFWEQREAPRAEAYYAESNIPYTYGSGAGERVYSPHLRANALAAVRVVWSGVEAMWQMRFELLFCNKYMTQHQHLGWHADDGEIVDPTRPIVVVSFGAEREIWFRKFDKEQYPEGHRIGCASRNTFETKPCNCGYHQYKQVQPEIGKLTLGHGSVLLMRAGMQQTHQHRIPKHDRPCGPRISLTFRGLLPST